MKLFACLAIALVALSVAVAYSPPVPGPAHEWRTPWETKMANGPAHMSWRH